MKHLNKPAFLALLLLAACNTNETLSRFGMGTQTVTPMGGTITPQQPVYCYQTIGKPDCFYAPQGDALPNRMVGMQAGQGVALPGGQVMVAPSPQQQPLAQQMQTPEMELLDPASTTVTQKAYKPAADWPDKPLR